jgi:hypothetical protein
MFFNSYQKRDSYFLFPSMCKEIKRKNIETYSQDLELDLFKEDG